MGLCYMGEYAGVKRILKLFIIGKKYSETVRTSYTPRMQTSGPYIFFSMFPLETGGSLPRPRYRLCFPWSPRPYRI